MKKYLLYLIIALIINLTSCIFTVGWNEFETEHIISDLYLESMDDNYHTLVLKESKSDNSGIIIVPLNIIQIGNNKRFVAVINCCDISESNQDTSYFIIDTKKYEDIPWYQKFFNNNSDKLNEFEFNNLSEFKNTLDSLTGNDKIKLREVISKK